LTIDEAENEGSSKTELRMTSLIILSGGALAPQSKDVKNILN
jgi:hypothetical protein